jgi:hypothetical protein
MYFAAAGSWVGTLVTWWQLRQALHESDTVPVPAWLWPGRQRGSAAARSRSEAGPENRLTVPPRRIRTACSALSYTDLAR